MEAIFSHSHERRQGKGGGGSGECCVPQPHVGAPAISNGRSHEDPSEAPAGTSSDSGREHRHEHERGEGSDGRGRYFHEGKHSHEGDGAGAEVRGFFSRRAHTSGSGEDTDGSAGASENLVKVARQSRVLSSSSSSSGPSVSSVQTVAPNASTSTSAATGVPTPAATPTTVTPAPVLSTTPVAQPSGANAKPQVASRSGKGSQRAHARTGDPSTASLSAASSGASVAPVAAKRASAADKGSNKRASHRSATPERLPPLVKTITKIVGVVPVALWALMGLLLALALALAVRSRVAALRARRLDRQRVQLLEDVGLLQAALLPVPPARLGPVATSVAYRPANGPAAGGDFYDVFALEDGRLGVIVGDISGHGRQALSHTALVRFTLRAYLEAGLSPRATVQTAGAVLDGALGGAFATVVVATYQPRDRLLTYAGAGHPPPVVLGSEALATRTAAGAPPIGTGMRTGTRQTVVSVPGFSQVCFHTDGVTEARMGSELFGSDRLASTLSQLGPQADAKGLLDSVAEQTDARPDDMAACLLTIAGEALPPAILVEQLELDGADGVGDRTERFLLSCGVEPTEVGELMWAAGGAAALGGPVLMEAYLDEGSVQVELHRDNVAPLLPRQARAAMGAGGAR
ncbi:MAG: PP2C family protein-serine/threonine phosphatase [Solirubrobacteraceae bacterium]